jgi:hypothetical protein
MRTAGEEGLLVVSFVEADAVVTVVVVDAVVVVVDAVVVVVDAVVVVVSPKLL